MLDAGGPITICDNKKVVIPSVESGILQPSLQNRFRVEIFGNVTKKESDLFTCQVISICLNYSNNGGTIILEQPEDGYDLHKFLLDWTEEEIDSINVSFLDRSEQIMSIICLENVKCINHNVSLDYASSLAVTHTIDFIFRGKIIFDPKAYDQT